MLGWKKRAEETLGIREELFTRRVSEIYVG